jgi:cyclic pyranopterin phosphate synthase
MRDTFDRSIDYLRISVTDRCNLRCVYCMPSEGVPAKPRAEILRFDEIVRVVEAAARLGIRRVRLTGGEPLVRANLPALVASISAIPGIEDISMTTNGLLLAQYAKDLAAAGLRRVNVSVDTLSDERFSQLSRVGKSIRQVLEGVRAAEQAGLAPIKINTVVVRGYNDDELADLARLTLFESWHVRFIELMPVGQCEFEGKDRFVPVDEMMDRLEAEFGLLTGAVRPEGGGPARYYRLPGARATVGFIHPISHYFCDSCNRLRLTPDGRLLPCLLSGTDLDLRAALRSGVTEERLEALIGKAVAAKPQRHYLLDTATPQARNMVQVGG